ncbi:alcohol dehydrogenase YqhD (iron-dependent ADH family) [Desulfohalotomaculum tongense]|uniref:iron-containing alcohol dehydrogenase n=1 Tax=Desulforadius tongensis TaxID=1216062 RepID=UPI00195C45B2|nr:iron-containing alcohol dehydrogenase [Desulforadius tongensis]MBM7854895.1 alcohol dehydrogenase YqhD (iron-dependent ADH family) [Desulforadius tongensis]
MQNFIFRNPTKLVFGKDTVKNIGTEINNSGIKKVLLVYGKGSIFKNKVYETVIRSLKNAGIEAVELGGVKSNPVLSKVYQGIELAKKENVEGVLAVGGGSVIDTAKTIAAGFYITGDIWDVFEKKTRVNKALPIFTVLTISATGSEMNPVGVITKEEENKKWGFGSPYTYPKVSIIDPTVQFSLPPHQTVYGAIDAMSHVFELYFGSEADTGVQDEIAEGIIRTIMKHVPVLLKEPDNYQSRAQLAWCATLALNGINQAGRVPGDWACHDIEHSLSAYYDIAHGAGLAIIIPAWMKYVYKENMNKFEQFAERIFNITGGQQEDKIIQAINSLKAFFQKLNAPTTLKEVGVKYSDLEKLAENTVISGPRGRIKKLSKNDIVEILKAAY